MNTTTQKSASDTLKEARSMIAVPGGWSHDTPTKQDEHGNIIARCAETAIASVQGGHPGAWKWIKKAMKPLANFASQMNGIAIPGMVNCQDDMTQEKVVGAFRQAEADARAAGE